MTHPVDDTLPPATLLVLGLQHVLVMYAGDVGVLIADTAASGGILVLLGLVPELAMPTPMPMATT